MSRSISIVMVVGILTTLLYALNSIAGTQTLYVSGSYNQTISQVSSAGIVSPFATMSDISVLYGLAFDHSGNLYVAQNGTDSNLPYPGPHQVSKITPGGSISVFATMPANSQPCGLAFGANDNLFVAGFHNDQISQITPGGVVSPFATLPSGSGPSGLAFDGSGNLYLADVNTDTISKITTGGVVSIFATLPPVPGGSAPYGLAFDRTGNLYVADARISKISKITPDLSISYFATLPAGSGPVGLAFDDNGYLYTANYGSNSISKIDPTGGLSPIPFAIGIAQPEFIAFSSVPVPAAAWTGGIGLFFVAVVRRIRRR